MSNDQGIRRKHKQRTVPHNKHSVFPGMHLSKDMMIVNQSIKPINPRPMPSPQVTPKVFSYQHPLWISYDSAAKRLNNLAGSAAQALRVKNEHEFFQAYRKLQREKLVPKLKRRYRP